MPRKPKLPYTSPTLPEKPTKIQEFGKALYEAAERIQRRREYQKGHYGKVKEKKLKYFRDRYREVPGVKGRKLKRFRERYQTDAEFRKRLLGMVHKLHLKQKSTAQGKIADIKWLVNVSPKMRRLYWQRSKESVEIFKKIVAPDEERAVEELVKVTNRAKQILAKNELAVFNMVLGLGRYKEHSPEEIMKKMKIGRQVVEGLLGSLLGKLRNDPILKKIW